MNLDRRLIIYWCFLFCTVHGTVLAQVNFDNYKTLKSVGVIPKDFSFSTASKIEEQIGSKMESLSKQQEKVFLEGIYYGIDELLHSGMVVYGDEISNYVSEIATKLLAEKFPALEDKLRFYTIKSNTANALSTDQGIVFVTTGLISQLSSEAQLAFVLAHEISHYTQHHVVEAFEYKSRLKSHRDRIRDLSVYSKEREMEADKLGISLFHSAGYAQEELLPTFDVLMYSYLPFDEIEFPKSYFNDSLLFVPEFLFPSKKFEIKAEEDYDDSKSTHPNIKSRKIAVERELKNFNDWGNEVYLLGQDRFLHIRNISRFESVRSSVLEAQYGDAMYSVFLLEKDFPNSTFLKKMKAHSWLGLAQYKNAGSINETIDKSSELEGEIACLHYFLKKLRKEAISSLALHEIHKIRNELSQDEETNVIWDRMVTLVAGEKSFDINKYSNLTFVEAANAFERRKDSSVVIPVNDEKLNKYERIKNKKNNSDPTVFDSTKFYYYGLTDVLKDELFVTRFTVLKDSLQKMEEEKTALEGLSSEERKKRYGEAFLNQASTIRDFILVEPSAISYNNGTVDYRASDKLEKKYTEAIIATGEMLDLSVYTINSDKLSNIGTVGFNERNVLTSFLLQMTHNDKVDILPVDYEYLKEIEANYGTSKIVFTIIEHTYKPKFSANAIWFIFYPPALLGYIPIPFMRGNETELNLIVVDSKKAKIENGVSYLFKEPTNIFILKARMYDILLNLTVTK
jgi:beta-barrel assembly-enhancing protease